jgi:hypothetical protein
MNAYIRRVGSGDFACLAGSLGERNLCSRQGTPPAPLR